MLFTASKNNKMSEVSEITEVVKTDKSFLHIIDHYISLDDADELFDFILNDMRDTLTINPTGKLFGKPITFHRAVGFYSDANILGYKFSGQRLQKHLLPTIFSTLLTQINAQFSTNFNAILVNVYFSGQDYISKHSDDEADLNTVDVIGISLGASRKFRVRPKTDEAYKAIGERKMVDVNTQHGQLLHMGGKFQSEFTHEVPPAGENYKSVRISLTFRHHLK